MMNFAIFLLFFKWSNACVPTIPDIELPDVQTTTEVDIGTTAQCPTGWDFVEGKCYQYPDATADWNTAFAACMALCPTCHLPRLYSVQQGLDVINYVSSQTPSPPDPRVWLDVRKAISGDSTSSTVMSEPTDAPSTPPTTDAVPLPPPGTEPVDDSGEGIEADSGAKLKEYVSRLKNTVEKKYYNTIRQVMGRVDKDEMDRALREIFEYVIKNFDQNEQDSILDAHERRKCGNDDAKDINFYEALDVCAEIDFENAIVKTIEIICKNRGENPNDVYDEIMGNEPMLANNAFNLLDIEENEQESEDEYSDTVMVESQGGTKRRKRGRRVTQKRRTQTDKERDAERKRNERESESQEQRENRMQRDTQRHREMRDGESDSQREKRLESQAERQRELRDRESDSQRSQRNQQNSQRQVTQRTNARRRRLNETTNLARETIEHEDYIQCLDVGNLDLECRHCKALFFEGEKVSNTARGVFTKCCRKGELTLENAFEGYPVDLYKLLTRNNAQFSKNFKENIRNYNSSFAFASMKAQSQVQSVMPFCYKIQGQIYHTINLAMHPDPNEKPEYAQLFFIESAEALNFRMSVKANANCSRDLMDKIDGILGPVNPYIQSFKSMREVEEEVEREAEQQGIEPPQLRLLFDINAKNIDKRRYNIPCSNEVAAVFVLDGEDMPAAEGLAIHQRGRQLQKISKFEKRAESMLYPLYFPTGKGGCFANMRAINNRKVTFAQYYRHMISIRRPSVLIENEDPSLNFLSEFEWEENPNVVNDFSPIRMGGKLFQQYLVDAYVKIEQDRITSRIRQMSRENESGNLAYFLRASKDLLEVAHRAIKTAWR
ncbi:hypothetical protein WR25_23385 [Diploscapter pachys]|uniref:Helitron helicase-like domain-containing protein n=1 Tax=Diploscapter pachys TaxID=2018661 RepID=A0A2A2J4P8_9BILA|nr:hypothetical protein WR25_23385 [Diploscapter pachys]